MSALLKTFSLISESLISESLMESIFKGIEIYNGTHTEKINKDEFLEIVNEQFRQIAQEKIK